MSCARDILDYTRADRTRRLVFFFQAEDGIRDVAVTGVQTCALPISWGPIRRKSKRCRRERIGAAVCAIFCGSVVANTNTTRGGGSSRVLRRAFPPPPVSLGALSPM